jgi:hypothetical protein
MCAVINAQRLTCLIVLSGALLLCASLCFQDSSEQDTRVMSLVMDPVHRD